MSARARLLDHYRPPEGYFVESLVATTYNIQWDFVEEELLPVALGVTAPTSKWRAYRSELERRLADVAVTILYDPRGCEKHARLSPRIDALLAFGRKQHAKISVLVFSRPSRKTAEGTELRVRLIIGSANLTKPGFRENLELVSVLEFGAGLRGPRDLLQAVLDFLREIAPPGSAQLREQLALLERFIGTLPLERSHGAPVFARGEEVLPLLRQAWQQLDPGKAPQRMTIVSPFWPDGNEAAAAVAAMVRHFPLPQHLDLVCATRAGPDGHSCLPVLPSVLPAQLQAQLGVAVGLRPAQLFEPAEESEADPDDSSEERVAVSGRKKAACERNVRHLHAKALVLEGARGAVLYIGSSNCTRRGLAVHTGPRNWEAGLVFQLRGKEAVHVDALLAFRGEPVAWSGSGALQTIEPDREPECPFPAFLSEVIVTAHGKLQLLFRSGQALPHHLRVQMDDARLRDRTLVWFDGVPGGDPIERSFNDCVQQRAGAGPGRVAPVGLANLSASVQVQWDGRRAEFPVRFEDKLPLPATPWARPLSEWELLEYYATGRLPPDASEEEDGPDPAQAGEKNGEPVPPPVTRQGASEVDVRNILSYQVRSLVEALPAIEAGLLEGRRSPGAMRSALFGATSPLALLGAAERALEQGDSAPRKTATSVGFAVIETIAVLDRCAEQLQRQELRQEVARARAACEQSLRRLEGAYPELCHPLFQQYRREFAPSLP